MEYKIKIKELSFSYGNNTIFDRASINFKSHSISAIIGRSGIGKSTFLMILNRLWESIPNTKFSGSVQVKWEKEFQDIYTSKQDLYSLRRKIGTVFQTPNPLPMSIYQNIAFPLKIKGEKDREYIQNRVEVVLKDTHLWNEVKDRLSQNALELSGGQQQRLCIARALILKPEILLIDEPTSSLDDSSRTTIEELIVSQKEQCTIIIISHYIDQVKRIADTVYSLQNGRFITT